MENEERNVSFTLNFDETLNGLAMNAIKEVIYVVSFMELLKRELEDNGITTNIEDHGNTMVFNFCEKEGFSLVINRVFLNDTMFDMHLRKNNINLKLGHVVVECKFGKPVKKLNKSDINPSIKLFYNEPIEEDPTVVELNRLVESCIDSVIENWDFEMIEG